MEGETRFRVVFGSTQNANKPYRANTAKRTTRFHAAGDSPHQGGDDSKNTPVIGEGDEALVPEASEFESAAFDSPYGRAGRQNCP